MPKITKRFVQALSAERAGTIVRDDELKGFGVRRNHDGTITYLVEYRAGRGIGFPVKRISVGRYGVLTAEQAWNQARDILNAAQKGGDVGADRKDKNLEITIGALMERAITSHWKALNRKSADNFEKIIKRNIIPRICSTRCAALAPA